MINLCVNLPQRPEKWIQVQREFKLLSGKAIRRDGVKLNPGYDGCRQAHLNILREMKDLDVQVFMITEDDLQFCSKNPQQEINQALSELPENWDMLYLGATLNVKPEKYSEHLYRLKRGWTTHGIIYNNQNGVVDRIIKDDAGGRKIDVYYADIIQEEYNCFIANPMIAVQRNGFSDILNKKVNNANIMRDYFRRHTT